MNEERIGHHPLATVAKGQTRITCSCGQKIGVFGSWDVSQGAHKRAIEDHQVREGRYELRELFQARRGA